MIQSYHLLDDWISPDPFWNEVQGWYNPTTFLMTEVHRIRSEPKSKDDTILPPSRWPNFTGSVLNRSSRMIQSYHIHRDRDLQIHFEPRFRDDAILPLSRGPRPPDTFWTEVQGWCNPPLSRGPRPPDTFWTEVQGWCNPTTFMGAETSRYILNRGSRMMQSHHIHEERSHRIYFGQMS